MATIREIYNVLFDFAPADMKLDWDNVGLACGHFDAEVHKILIALDPMPDVFEEAKARSCELVVTHHPLLFQGVKQVSSDTYAGNCLLYLIENGIAAMNLHTNLDCCPGGVNDVLAAKLGLEHVEILHPMGTDRQGRPYGLVRMGTVPEQSLAGFASFVKQALSCPGVRFADAGKSVRKVAVGGGSCGSEIDAVLAAGCDTFVTADLKYNQFEEAKYRGLNLIDAGHFETENPVCEVLERILREAYPEIPVFRAQKHHDETQFL